MGNRREGVKRKKEGAYANESMCREWREPRQCYPESRQRICRKVIGADWEQGGLPGWIDFHSLFLALSVFCPLRLLQCGGGGELIIGAVKPSQSLMKSPLLKLYNSSIPQYGPTSLLLLHSFLLSLYLFLSLCQCTILSFRPPPPYPSIPPIIIE